MCDLPAIQHVGNIRDLQSFARVLFDQQNRDALRLDVADDAENLIDHEGSESHAGFVEHEQAGVHHQGATNGEHLLFAAAEQACPLVTALVETGKTSVNVVQIRLERGFVCPNNQVFVDGHGGDHLPPFGNLNQ